MKFQILVYIEQRRGRPDNITRWIINWTGSISKVQPFLNELFELKRIQFFKKKRLFNRNDKHSERVYLAGTIDTWIKCIISAESYINHSHINLVVGWPNIESVTQVVELKLAVSVHSCWELDSDVGLIELVFVYSRQPKYVTFTGKNFLFW